MEKPRGWEELLGGDNQPGRRGWPKTWLHATHVLAHGGCHGWEVMHMEAHERLVVAGVSIDV